MKKRTCRFYGDLDRAVETVQAAVMYYPEDDGGARILKVADHPMVTAVVWCKKFRVEPDHPRRLHW